MKNYFVALILLISAPNGFAAATFNGVERINTLNDIASKTACDHNRNYVNTFYQNDLAAGFDADWAPYRFPMNYAHDKMFTLWRSFHFQRSERSDLLAREAACDLASGAAIANFERIPNFKYASCSIESFQNDLNNIAPTLSKIIDSPNQFDGSDMELVIRLTAQIERCGIQKY